MAIEVKTGRQRASRFIRQQIIKDAKLLQADQVASSEWHFFPNRNGVIDIDPDLLKYLDNPSLLDSTLPATPIRYVIYWP